jgi:hypothetical protein
LRREIECTVTGDWITRHDDKITVINNIGGGGGSSSSNNIVAVVEITIKSRMMVCADNTG